MARRFILEALSPTNVRHRCIRCACIVNPDTHVPDSDDCVAAAVERNISRTS